MSVFVKKQPTPSTPTMRAPTTSERVMGKVGETMDKVLPNHPIKSLLEKLIPTSESPEDVASNLTNPLSAVAAGIIPKQFLKKFAQENAEKAYKYYSLSGAPKVANVASTMLEKHPYVGGHIADFHASNKANLSGGYYPMPTAKDPFDLSKFDIRRVAPDMLARKKISNQPVPSLYETLQGIGTDEDIARVIKMNLGSMEFNLNHLENDSLEEVFKTFRHEFSHAADDITGKDLKSTFYPGGDPRYWVSTPEVRARAVERNYGRDMGQKAKRTPYGDNLLDELEKGFRIAHRQQGQPFSVFSMFSTGDPETPEDVAKETFRRYKPLIEAVRKKRNRGSP